jgi:hypothetical protein
MAEPSHDPKRQVHLNVELPADLDAIYSNIAFITHSPSEMIIDFGRVLPNVPKAKIHVRVILTPMNAKLLHQALGENSKLNLVRSIPNRTGLTSSGRLVSTSNRRKLIRSIC